VNASTKKVEDEELEQILDENPCQTQLELTSQLGASHFLSPTEAVGKGQ